jgi:hypothetical protein
MSTPGGPQQPHQNEQFGQQGGFPPPGDAQPGGFPPPNQPGQFPPPNQAGGFPPGPPPQQASRGGGMRKRIVTIVIALVVIGGIAAVSAFLNRDAASKAKVGDCVSQEGSDDLSVVKCGDAKAKFKVVGRVENKTQAEAGVNACGPFVDQGATQAYWEGEQGKKGLVLCLAPNG